MSRWANSSLFLFEPAQWVEPLMSSKEVTSRIASWPLLLSCCWTQRVFELCMRFTAQVGGGLTFPKLLKAFHTWYVQVKASGSGDHMGST